MTAVIRVKRHLDEEPLSALILNCKKRKKCADDNESEVSTVLKFAGTLSTQEDDIASHISKLTKDDLEQSYKRHIPNITSKVRQQTKDASDSSRFKIVNFFRSIDKETTATQTEACALPETALLTVLDVENECESHNSGTDLNYVYDIYYTNSEGIEDHESDSDYRICPINEVIFDSGDVLESDHDSDDSNDENNWRNDYPDEEDDDSFDENDMRNAMGDLSLDGEDLSSEDDGQAGFMYSIDSEGVGFEEDLDHTDNSRYGEMYARFKLRQKKVEESYNKDLYHAELDDTEEDFLD